MNVLTLQAAQQIIEEALAGPRSGPERYIAVVVVDAGGHPLAMARQPEAPPLLSHIAEAKAKSCIVYGKPTRSIMQWADETPTWFQGVSRVSQDRMGLPLIGSLGGVLIVSGSNRIGAVGVAGEAGASDEALAVRGIEASGYTAQIE